MQLPKGAALSHASAAAVWGIELVDADDRVHLTVPRDDSKRRWSGRLHRSDLGPHEIAVVDGVLVTSPLRTVLDLARVLSAPAAVAAADSAVRRGLLTADEVRRAAGRTQGRGAAAVRSLARLVDERSESVLESVIRVVLVLGGCPPPAVQHVVCDGARFVARVDFAWPEQRLVVEADGFAFHADRAAYRADRARMNELERLGWRVLRFTWEDALSRPGHVVALVQSVLGVCG